MIWTENMKKALKMLEAKGYSYTKIAKIMSIAFRTKLTKNATVGMAARMGIPKRPSPIVIKPPLKLGIEPEITITDLEWGMCKWPLGEPDDKPPYFFCGKPTGDISCSWCPEHRQRVWTKSRF